MRYYGQIPIWIILAKFLQKLIAAGQNRLSSVEANRFVCYNHDKVLQKGRSNMPQILIVEDDVNITKMLEATLTIGSYTYESCGDGNEAVLMICSGKYDLVLLDIMLPGLNGFEVLDTVRSAGRDTPVIFLTALGSVADKVKGLRGGAEDYIVNPFEAMELLARIEVVLRRAGKDRTQFQYEDIEVDIDRHRVTKADVPIILTPKEFDVLVFFMRNQDIVITREQLLQNIWGFSFTGESRYVDIHVQQVRRKLSLQNSLITVPKIGYRLNARTGTEGELL